MSEVQVWARERTAMSPPALSLLPSPAPPAQASACCVVSGPAFPVVVKVLATVLMVGLVVAGALAAIGGVSGPPLAAAHWGFLAAVAAVVGTGYWGMMTSRTRFDGVSIEQTWIWNKKILVAEITQLKLVSVPGLNWLIVPRLMVRTRFGPIMSDRRML